MRRRTGPNPASARECDASCGDGTPAAPKSMLCIPTASWRCQGSQPPPHTSPLQGFAACPAASSPLILVEVDAGGLLQQIHSGYWDGTGQPHTRHSPGPFQLSGSWGFSPGSGFSGSFGLSRASLDSAAGGGRQQVRGGHSRGCIPQGLGPPEQRHPGRGFTSPWECPISPPQPLAHPCHATPAGRAPLPFTALFVAYS